MDHEAREYKSGHGHGQAVRIRQDRRAATVGRRGTAMRGRAAEAAKGLRVLRDDLFDRSGHTVVETLVQFETKLHTGLGFGRRFHALGQGLNSQITHHPHQAGQHVLALGWSLIDVPGQGQIELEHVRRHLDQFDQASLPGPDVVVGQS